MTEEQTPPPNLKKAPVCDDCEHYEYKRIKVDHCEHCCGEDIDFCNLFKAELPDDDYVCDKWEIRIPQYKRYADFLVIENEEIQRIDVKRAPDPEDENLLLYMVFVDKIIKKKMNNMWKDTLREKYSNQLINKFQEEFDHMVIAVMEEPK